MEESKIRVGSMTLGMIQTNCYFVYLEDGQSHEPQTVHENRTHCIVFDPADRGDFIYDALTDRGFTIDLILLTHAHFDHIGGVSELRKLSKAPLYCYEAEKALCENADNNCSVEYGRSITFTPDRYLPDLEMISAAGIQCQLLATPGHTVGSCCYYIEQGHILLSGDTLFEDSVGRTDMPTGSMSALVRSVRQKLMPLPDDTVVYPGHGGTTTIGHERDYNEFL